MALLYAEEVKTYISELEVYAEELRIKGSIWINEETTAEFMMYLGIETDYNYLLTYDTRQPIRKVQFCLY